MRTATFGRYGLRLVGLLALGATLAGPIAGCSSADPETPAVASGGGLEDQLAKDTGATWSVELDAELGTPSFVSPRGPTAPALGAGEPAGRAARAFLAKYAAHFGIGGDADLLLESSGTSAVGLRHASFTQTASGLPVFATRMTVHYDAAGAFAFASGQLVPDPSRIDRTPTVDRAAAIAAAARSLGLADVIAEARLGIDATTKADAKLAWEITVTAPASYRVFVDAKSAAILRALSLSMDAHAVAEGVNAYLTGQNKDAGDLRRFPIEGLAPYEMRRAAVAGGLPNGRAAMQMYDGSGDSDTAVQSCSVTKFDASKLKTMTSKDRTAWDSSPTLVRRYPLEFQGKSYKMFADGRGMAPSAMANFEYIDEFYRTVFARNSWDGQGAAIRLVVHEPGKDGNASWDGGRKLFSLGDVRVAESVNPQLVGAQTAYGAAVDVSAHEFQHAVTATTVDLEYVGQSGALNESISDVFGAVADAWKPTNADEFQIGARFANPYLIGEDALGEENAIRSMMDPSQGEQPFHMSQLAKSTNDCAGDQGGVHKNSGIPNFAFYLMTKGGLNCPAKKQPCPKTIPPTSVAVPIDIMLAGRIYYALLTSRSISPRATFADMARAMVATAEKVQATTPRGIDKASNAVACAWVGVGAVTSDEAKRNWKIDCATAALEHGAELAASCANDPDQECTKRFGAEAFCTWNGDNYCCKKQYPVTTPCFSDADCKNGDVCALSVPGADQKFGCTKPNTPACLQ